jgi:hypothetical protein
MVFPIVSTAPNNFILSIKGFTHPKLLDFPWGIEPWQMHMLKNRI